MTTGFRRTAAWCAGGAALPCAAWGATLALSPASPLALWRAPRLLSIVTSDAFVLEAIALTVAGPIAGAAAGRRLAGPAAGLAAFTLASAVLAAAALSAGALDAGRLIQSRATLLVVGAAIVAFGASCGRLVANVLDAIAVALGVTLVLAAGLFAVGPAAAGLSERSMNAGLLASPPVAIAASAGIDVLRTELLYQLTPIAHRRFTYPGAAETWLVYGFTALAGALVARRRGRPSSTGALTGALNEVH